VAEDPFVGPGRRGGPDRSTCLALFLAGALLAGCRGKRQPTELEVPAPSPPPSAPVPVDRALPDELAEGSEKAFGLPLPRLMTVRAPFDAATSLAPPIPPPP